MTAGEARFDVSDRGNGVGIPQIARLTDVAARNNFLFPTVYSPMVFIHLSGRGKGARQDIE